MFKYLLIMTTLVASLGASAQTYLPIVRIIDGDTIKTHLNDLPPSLASISIRILGIDTPEKNPRAKCAKENLMGIKATIFLQEMAKDIDVMEVRNMKWDKFGGRIDGDVFIDGKSVSEELIKANLARPYDGGKKLSWCK